MCSTKKMLLIMIYTNAAYNPFTMPMSVSYFCLYQEHESFIMINMRNERNPYNDVSVVKIRKIPKWTQQIRPICLPSGTPSKFVGEDAIISGWGFTKNVAKGKPSCHGALKNPKWACNTRIILIDAYRWPFICLSMVNMVTQTEDKCVSVRWIPRGL